MYSLGWLYRVFDDALDRNFIIWREQMYSYAWLREHVEAWKSRLAAANIVRGAVVAIEGDYSPEVIALLLALIDAGCIVVPLAGSNAPQREEFKSIAEVQAAICFPEGDRFDVVSYDRAVTNPLTRKLIAMGDPGLVLVLLWINRQEQSRAAQLRPPAREISSSPQFPGHAHYAVAGPHRRIEHAVLRSLQRGSRCGRRQSRSRADLFGDCAAPSGATAYFAHVPNLLLISEAWKRHDLSSLRRITYGTEVMPARTLQRLHEILPEVDLLQTYGLSELGILRSKSRSSDSLWVRVGGEGVEIKVENGTLRIRTRSAMLGYLNAPSPFDNDGWFDTGDNVEVDGEYLRILGRKSEVINVGGEKVFPVEVENVLLDMPNVKDVTVSAMPNPITGHVVTARFNLFEPEELPVFRRRMREFCSSRLAAFKVPAKIEIVNDAQYGERLKKMRRNSPPAPGIEIQEAARKAE